MEQGIAVEFNGPRKVRLWCVVDSEAEKQAVRVAAELVEGVKAVENNVTVLSFMAVLSQLCKAK